MIAIGERRDKCKESVLKMRLDGKLPMKEQEEKEGDREERERERVFVSQTRMIFVN